MSSSSSSLFLSSCRSSSSLPESSEGEESKKTKQSKISKFPLRHHASSGSRKWRQVAYQHQHDVNGRIGEKIGAVKRAVKSKKTKNARRRVK